MYEEIGYQFAKSQHKEINSLIKKGVFKIVDILDIPPSTQIFNLWFVDEIKLPGTNKVYEKSRLVIQAYNNINKTSILTELSTIQYYSQHLILYLTLCKKDLKLYL